MNDEIWGKKGVAFIKTNSQITDENIRDFLKDKLAKFKQPKEFFLMKDFPVTGFGKISRKDLIRIFHENKYETRL